MINGLGLSSKGLTNQTLLSSMARFEANFGREFHAVKDVSNRREALPSSHRHDYKPGTPNELPPELSGVWRTSERVGVDDGIADHADGIQVPEPIWQLFEETIGTDSYLARKLMTLPAYKFSFEPPQMHTMPDLPIEEWYNFDWLGIMDAVFNNGTGGWDLAKSFMAREYSYAAGAHEASLMEKLSDPNKYDGHLVLEGRFEDLKSRFREILPDNPSPKNEEEAFFWQELKETGVTPWDYYKIRIKWEHTKRLDEVYALFGVDRQRALAEENHKLLLDVQVENFAVFDELQNSMKGLAALGWGGHWQDADYDGYQVSKTYGQIIDGIKEDPRYKQTFDESIPYQERESIRIELDKQIRQSLEQGWIKFLAEVEREMLHKEPLKMLLKEKGA